MSRPTPSATELAASLVAAIERRDAAGLVALLATPVRFRAVTPGRFWDGETPTDVVDVVLGTWFTRECAPRSVTSLDVDPAGAQTRVRYRLETAGGLAVEQVAYLTIDSGRITGLRLVCSGFWEVTPVTA